MHDRVAWWQSPSRLTVIEKALSTAVGGCHLTSWKQSVTRFPAKNFPVLNSVGVQHKTTMGKAGIRQGLYLVLGKLPAPSEFQEWQESLVRGGLFASASEFSLMFLQHSRSQYSLTSSGHSKILSVNLGLLHIFTFRQMAPPWITPWHLLFWWSG